MTAIAIIPHRLRTVAIGDLLVSGPEPDRRGLILPMRGSIEPVFPKGAGFVPVGLRQKLFGFSRNGLLCCAGPIVKAMEFADTLASEFLGTVASSEVVRSGLERLDARRFGELSFVVLVSEAERVALFRRVADAVDERSFFAIGTGRDLLAPRIAALLGTFDRQRTVEPPPHVDIWLDATCLHSSLVRIELGRNDLLLNYAGGGYEFAVSNPDEFGKLTDFSHLFVDVFVRDGRHVSIGDMWLYHQHYSDEDLIIRSVALRHTGDRWIAGLPSVVTTTIPPLIRLGSPKDLPYSAFGTSRVRVLHMSVFDDASGMLIGAIPRFNYLGADDEPKEYTIATDGASLTVALDKDSLLAEVGQFLRQRPAQSARR